MGLLLRSPEHGDLPASGWVRRWSHLLAPGARVLDVACGQGRHVRWLAARGHTVTGIDRDPTALLALADLAATGLVHTVQADIENAPWPLAAHGVPHAFDAVVVTNYLWRPLLPTILQSVAPGGVLLYETFAHGHARVGRPARPEFLLQPGELLQVCAGLRIVAFEDGFCAPPERYVQRIAAVRERPHTPDSTTESPAPPRYLL